jgi:SAM-dependent methyltransferase
LRSVDDLDALQPVDPSVPNAARMYEWYLGGDNNFPADREAAEHVLRVAPQVRATALENRAFLSRAVAFLAGEAGIRQFIDIGAGLPTRGSVHEIAHDIAPDARVAYVDNDRIVLGQTRALLARVENAATIRADLRNPAGIINHPDLTGFIDWDRPVALLLVAVLHFLTDDDHPAAILRLFREVLAPGSHLVITHAHHEGDEDVVREVIRIYRSANVPLVLRTREQIAGLFDGFGLLEPGLVALPDWRPEPRPYPPGDVWALGGVARLSAVR